MKQKNIFKMLGMLVTMALLFAAMPVGSAQADWSTFDNPDYYYADITSAPVGTFYRSAGFNPDGTKIVAQKSWGTQTEVVLMNADGSGEIIISPGDSGTGDIAQYGNPFWSDDGTVVGFVEVHNTTANKVIAYDISTATRSYIFEPVSNPDDVANPDFLGSSKTSIVFWAYGDVGGADIWIWDGTTATNITDTDDYKEYEPISNADGTKILYWSGESTAEPVNTTHTLTDIAGTWTKDVSFSPIPDSYWSYWSTSAATEIALTVMSTKDIHLYDNTGTFLADLSGPGYSGGSGQWNFFGSMPKGPNGEYVITSNADRGILTGRDIVIANPRLNLFVSSLGSDDNPGTEAAPFATIQKAIDESVDGTVISVGAGTYAENLLVNKSVEIAGESQANVTILPALSAPNPCSNSSMCGGAASNVVLVAASDVSIHDLTIDGDNPALTSGVVRGGADLDARNGIIKNTDATYDNLEVYNTTVKNIYLRGIYSTGGSFNFHVNTVTNVLGDYNSIAIFAWGGPGTIEQNVVSYANDAISANHSKGIQFLNNTITFSSTGMHTDNSNDAGGVADVISGNTIDCTGVSDAYGIFTFVPYVAPTVSNNTITNCAVGLSAWGEGLPVITQFANNLVTGDLSAGSVGALVTTNIIYYGYRDVSVNFTGNDISGFETGVQFMADAPSWEPDPFVPKTINATFRSNKIYGNTYDIVQDTNGLAYNTDLSLNWWGSACGPDSVTGDVTYSPWYADEAMTVTVSGEPGSYTFSTGATTDIMNSVIACAPPDTTFTMDAASLPGGLVVHGNDLTFNLNGATVGAGSPAFEIFGDNVTINGPGTLDGDHASSGIVVHDGADNLIIDKLEIKNWIDGVSVEGSHESFKLVNSWLHSNGAAGLLTDNDTVFTGVVTIEGNLFKANGSHGVAHNGPEYLDATYNSWGYVTGPQGTDVVGLVTYEPWTFSEIYMDMDPIADDQYTRHVTSTEAFDVEIRAEAANLYGLSFIFQYDNTKLALANIVFDAVWDGPSGDGFCEPLDDLAADEIGYFCTLLYPDAEWDGGKIATFTFNAIDSGDATFDVYADDTLSTAAAGGVKVWVNNAGFNDPSNPDRDITDEVDGLIDIDIAQYTGFIDLEGRPDDSGALVTVYDDALGTTALASATSASSGAYTTAYLTGQSLNFEATQYIKVDRALFLPTYLLSKELTDSPLTFVQLLKLLGGDATNDDVIDIADASCIGAAYGSTGGVCGVDGTSDVNGDGVVNIYDLTLMGGNYSKVQTPW